MVFGWGKKKNQEPETSIQEEKKMVSKEVEKMINDLEKQYFPSK